MNIHDVILEKIVGVNKKIGGVLINASGDSRKVLELSNDHIANLLHKHGFEEEKIKRFLEKKGEFNRDEKSFIGKCNLEMSEIRKDLGAEIISFSDQNYPKQLKEIDAPPLNLYVKGNFDFDFNKSMAIVGTRNISAYAREKTAEIARDLAKAGFCIISGLARGTDGQAHSATVAHNKQTIAVLPFLSDRVYPPEHMQLAEDIIAHKGALVSENFLFDKVYDRALFTERNRIISGLSRAILIIEGSEKSGSLSQYNHAKRQQKIIFTLKPIKEHEGTYLPHKIIKEEGIGIESAKEIIEALNKN